MSKTVVDIEHQKETGYYDLANAIVGRAASDYSGALSRLQHRPHDRRARATVNDCERFFGSKWFGILSSADADQLTRDLRAGARCKKLESAHA